MSSPVTGNWVELNNIIPKKFHCRLSSFALRNMSTITESTAMQFKSKAQKFIQQCRTVCFEGDVMALVLKTGPDLDYTGNFHPPLTTQIRYLYRHRAIAQLRQCPQDTQAHDKCEVEQVHLSEDVID